MRATSAREALRCLLLDDFALILLDVQMPGLTGFELAELIRERERTQNTPIIFITADTSEKEFIFRGYSLGAVDYLTKPIEPEILRSKVGFFSKYFLQQQEIKSQARELEAANERLDSINFDLEERVRRRTAELEIANRDLQAEIAERRQSEARLATEHEVTRALSSAESVAAARGAILRAFIDHMNASVAAMWELAPGGTELECVQVETAESDAGLMARFVEETRNLRVRPGVGLPGRVWEKMGPVWLPNTLRGEKYPRATLAAGSGLHSATGFPIKIEDEFYGVIEFFCTEPVEFSKQMVNMLDAVCSEIGQFIRRRRVEDERENLIKVEKGLRAQAERANRLKDEFLATVSHELRTPLNSILGWSQLVISQQIGPDEVRTALETIQRNARSQSQLINDLLDASRLITGKLTLELAPTDAIDVVESAVDVIRPTAAAKNIEIATNYPDAQVAVTCDPTRLQQMVWNLLANAVKFTPEKGRIDVACEVTERSVEISVTDSGVGITPEFLPFVFERFRQEDSSSTRQHQGLGLGLSIVRSLAELHGGGVSVASDGPGKGAKFTISLPFQAGTEEVEKSEQIVSPNGELPLQGLFIQVVDDDLDACEWIKIALSMYGASVRTANSVRQAIASISERPPDVLLADINMPGEDGYALIRQLRNLENERAARTPAIALTALARDEDSERALEAGFELHLAKPIEIEDLSRSIAELIGYKS